MTVIWFCFNFGSEILKLFAIPLWQEWHDQSWGKDNWEWVRERTGRDWKPGTSSEAVKKWEYKRPELRQEQWRWSEQDWWLKGKRGKRRREKAKSEVAVLCSWGDDQAIIFGDHSAVLLKPRIVSREGGRLIFQSSQRVLKCLSLTHSWVCLTLTLSGHSLNTYRRAVCKEQR